MPVAGSTGDAGTAAGFAGGTGGFSNGGLGGSSGDPAGRGGVGGAGQGGSGGTGKGALPRGVDGDGRLFFYAHSGNPFVTCTPTKPCAAPAVCFELTTDFGICDTPQPIESTECTPPAQMMGIATGPDECGCGGLACRSGETCVSFEETCSCSPSLHNTCVATACTAPSECPGTVCTPSSFIHSPTERCFTPKCAADSDCTADGEGRCALLIYAPSQEGEYSLLGVECVYPGNASDAGVCADAGGAEPDGHTCP